MTLRHALPAIAACAVIGLAMPANAKSDRGQEQLAKLLDGRVAGEPTDCVSYRPSARLYMIDETALVYDAGSTIYINYTRYPKSLDDGDYLVVRDPAPSLCRTTQISTRSRSGNFFNGIILLEDFIPYKRVKDEG